MTDRTGAATALVRSSSFRATVRVLYFGVLGLTVGVLAIVAAAAVPTLAGYHTYAVNGSSMEPALQLGSAAVTKPTSPASLEVGDIIVRRDSPAGSAVLHRIVGIEIVDGQRLFTTQGDQNDTPEAEPAILSGPGDKVVYSVPYAGYILNFGSTWPGRTLLIGAPLALLAALLLRDVQRALGISGRANNTAGGPKPRREQSEAPALLSFLLRHSGQPDRSPQCAEHAPITQLPTLELMQALRSEAGLTITRTQLAEVCSELDIPFGTPPGRPSQTAEERDVRRAA